MKLLFARDTGTATQLRKRIVSVVAFGVLFACAPLSAHALTITKHENWENLEFLPGQTFRIYTPAQFHNAIPNWKVQAAPGSSYGVEHQHSRITWRQAGTNDDFLELDSQAFAGQPQVYTEFDAANNYDITKVSIDFNAAGRPDYHATSNLVLYGRIDDQSWKKLDSFSIFGATSTYPNFSPYSFSLNFAGLMVNSFDFGFACTNCGGNGGYGPLLGSVTARYTVEAGTSTEVPEPATVLLLSAALGGAARRRKKAQRGQAE